MIYPAITVIKEIQDKCLHIDGLVFLSYVSYGVNLEIIFGSTGKAANMVDSNLDILRRRIDEVRQREKPKDCPWGRQSGWNHHPHVHGYDTRTVSKKKKKVMLVEAVELIILASSSLGLVLLCGSLCMCLVSFLVHLNY